MSTFGVVVRGSSGNASKYNQVLAARREALVDIMRSENGGIAARLIRLLEVTTGTYVAITAGIAPAAATHPKFV